MATVAAMAMATATATAHVCRSPSVMSSTTTLRRTNGQRIPRRKRVANDVATPKHDSAGLDTYKPAPVSPSSHKHVPSQPDTNKTSAARHDRHASGEKGQGTSASDAGSSFSSLSSSDVNFGFCWLLEHLELNPTTYEIPLRTMYELNSAATPSLPVANKKPSSSSVSSSSSSETQRYHSARSAASSPDSQRYLTAKPGPITSAFTTTPETTVAAAESFRNVVEAVMERTALPGSLPPHYATSRIRYIFPPSLEAVDFEQTLTALDYLRDLEMRRRSEVIEALGRLGVHVNRETSSPDLLRVESTLSWPVKFWVMDTLHEALAAENLYSQCYIGLRRWIMINEMVTQPFDRRKCISMLNTLYPPMGVAQPTKTLTPTFLEDQRSILVQNIQAVEGRGWLVLDGLVRKGLRAERGEWTGWPATQERLEQYLVAANKIIARCAQATDVGCISGGGNHAPAPRPMGDMGTISIVTRAPSSDGSNKAGGSSSSSSSADGPPAPLFSDRQRDLRHKSSGSGGKFFGKLARELRKLGGGGGGGAAGCGSEATDHQPAGDGRGSGGAAAATAAAAVSDGHGSRLQVPVLPPLPFDEPTRSKSLKKAKSFSALRDRKKSHAPVFDLSEEARARAIREARAAKGEL